MCGRYSLSTDVKKIARHFNLAELPALWPRYNAAPGQDLPVVRVDERGERRLELLHWGLVPAWAEDPKIGHRMINARAESAAGKPAFRAAFRRRRCLVPADGFYEWRKLPAGREPLRIRRRDGEVFAFAGLWERWEEKSEGQEEKSEGRGARSEERREKGEGGREREGGRQGELFGNEVEKAPADGVGAAGAGAGSRDQGWRVLESFTILTTAANALLAPVHERMPVILAPEEYALWLDAGVEEVGRLQALLRPAPAESMEMYAVSRRVNSPRCDDPNCIAPA